MKLKHTFWSAFLAVRLHGNMGIQVIKCAIGLLAAIPSTFIHALNFFITSPWAFVLLRAGDRDEGVYLG
jgi:hypothetical protein